jgi:hypothetical protein
VEPISFTLGSIVVLLTSFVGSILWLLFGRGKVTR